MDTTTKRGLTAFIFLAVVTLIGAWLIWQWGFCRFYVPPGAMAIVTAKVGEQVESGQILARPGQKGVLEEPLAEGRHFLNPVLYEREIVPAIRIPAGKVGIVTSKIGTQLPAGEFLADKGQKGIWRRVLGPGVYRLNPVGYKVDIVDAISVPIGYVGVVTSLSGNKAPEGQFAGPNQKGVRKDVLQPGLYYVNSNEFKTDILEIGLNQVSLTGREGGQVFTKTQMDIQNTAMDELISNVLAKQQAKRQGYLQEEMAKTQQLQPSQQPRRRSSSSWERDAARGPGQMNVAQQEMPPTAAPQMNMQQGAIVTLGLTQFVEFPSRDGFEIRLDMTVEFEFLPTNIAEIYLRYGDLPAVVDKIIMPQILSVSRLKGSSYRAQDFIVGEGREKFQDDLKETLAAILKTKYILVHNSLIRHVDVPDEILQPIQQASVAVEQNLTNIERQNTARKQAELNTAETLIEQRRQEVQQETEKLAAEIAAATEAEVASIGANTQRQVAEINRDTAAVKADITRRFGEADARILSLVEGEKAKGFQLKVEAMGDADAYAWLNFAEHLNPQVRLQILHAGPGTLWTDLKNATTGDLGGAQILKVPPAHGK